MPKKEAKRTHLHEMKCVPLRLPQEGEHNRYLMTDLRVRVDMNAIGRALAKKAADKKGHRAILLSGAIVVEAFNVVACAPPPPAGSIPPDSDGGK